MINEIICVVFGFAFGAIFMAFYNARANSILLKEIGRLRTLLTLKEILTLVIVNLAKSVLDPFFETIKIFEEKNKDGTKSKGKNNIHKRS